MATVFTIGGNTVSYGGFLLREMGGGSLTISKTVTGTGFDPAKTFELTVTFSRAVTYNGTTSTTHTFHLASGQSVTIDNIPEDTDYEVVEAPLSQIDLEAGYRIGSMTGGSGTIPYSGSLTAAATNIYAHGSLTLNLVVNGSGYNASKLKYTVTFDSPIRYSVNGVLIEALSDTYSGDFSQGTPVVLGSIPQNVSYTITETPFSEADANSGYSTGTITGATGIMPYNGSLSATLRYSYVNIPATVNGYRFKFAGSPEPGWQQDASGEWIHYAGTDIYDLITGATSLTLDVFKRKYTNTRWYTGKFEIIRADPEASVANTYRFDFAERITRAVNLNLGSSFFADDMFAGCTALTEVAFTNTPQLLSCERMFLNCQALTSISAVTLKPYDSQYFPEGVGSVYRMFEDCRSLESLPSLNTGAVRYFGLMCYGCASLKTIPLLATDAALDVGGTFGNCYKVESGAFALYNQMAAQADVPAHSGTFTNCGRDTQTGAAELAQIPSDWK